MKIGGIIIIYKDGWQHTYDFDQREENEIAYACSNGNVFQDGWIDIQNALDEIKELVKEEEIK